MDDEWMRLVNLNGKSNSYLESTSNAQMKNGDIRVSSNTDHTPWLRTITYIVAIVIANERKHDDRSAMVATLDLYWPTWRSLDTYLSYDAFFFSFFFFNRNRYFPSREIKLNQIGPHLDLLGNVGTKKYDLTANLALNETFDAMAISMPLAPESGFWDLQAARRSKDTLPRRMEACVSI